MATILPDFVGRIEFFPSKINQSFSRQNYKGRVGPIR